MKALLTREFGDADSFELVDVPEPTPGAGEVLMKNAYAGVIYADTLIRRGGYLRWKAAMPSVLGSEVVGTIVALGDGVEGLAVGDRVSAELVRGGAYQELSVAPASRTTVIPDEASFEEAVVYSFNLPAAYLMYHHFTPIASDATVLIHSAAGGLGTMLTLVAKENGNRVIAVVSDESKREACIANGADEVISRAEHPDYENEVLRLTDGEGVDVSINHVAGSTLVNDLKALKFRGMIMLSNALEGLSILDPEGSNLYYNKCAKFVVAASATLYGTEEHRPALDFLSNWLKRDGLQAPTAVFPFSKEGVGDAHRLIESGTSVGKIAIRF
jgi:NADPH2:quinone reductase